MDVFKCKLHQCACILISVTLCKSQDRACVWKRIQFRTFDYDESENHPLLHAYLLRTVGKMRKRMHECIWYNQVFCICMQQGPFTLGGRDVKPGTQWTLVRKEHDHHGNHHRKHRHALWTLGLASHQQCKYNIVILLEAEVDSIMDRHVREN